MKTQAFAIIVMGLVLCSCAAQPLPDNRAFDTLRVPVAYFLSFDDDIAFDGQPPARIAAEFPLIPGAIVGVPTEPLGLSAATTDGNDMILHLSAFERSFELKSRAVVSGPTMAGATTRPSGLRFSRLGSFAFDYDGEVSVGATGFRDLLTNDDLVLTWFSDAGTLTGATRPFEGAQITYDVRIPAAGFHWLRISGPADDELRATYATPASVRPALAVELRASDI